ARGMAYTNGHIAVVALGQEEAENSTEAHKHLAKTLDDIVVDCFLAESDWLPIPDVDSSLFTCTYCAGTGKVETCPECKGLGSIEFENDFNDYEVDCKSCESDSGH